MNAAYKNELITIVDNDPWMLHVLKLVRDLDLNDCWVGAGFVRNKVWDVKHVKPRTPLDDVDVIYHDTTNITEDHDLQIEKRLNLSDPGIYWSVKNQARMHIKNGHTQYADCCEAMSYWPETATAVAVRLNAKDKLECVAPYMLHDLFNLLVRPTSKADLDVYKARVKSKNWKEIWSRLTIED